MSKDLSRRLMKAGDVLPDLLVEPEGLEGATATKPAPVKAADIDDPLLRTVSDQVRALGRAFLNELRKQRRSHIIRILRKKPSCPFRAPTASRIHSSRLRPRLQSHPLLFWWSLLKSASMRSDFSVSPSFAYTRASW